jgi:hypothetical protein
MEIPGEVPQEIGRAYLLVLIGCLERTVSYFRQSFDVLTAPEKLVFSSPTGNGFSFDAVGAYSHPLYFREVLLESKGHKDGAKVLDGYKEFLAKAYVTTVNYDRHKTDLFWFVTNVPFGCATGRKLTSFEFVQSTLCDRPNQRISAILGETQVNPLYVQNLTSRLCVSVFTDSFIRVMGISYLVRRGENVWTIIKAIHGGHVPTPTFAPIADLVARFNNLKDVNRIRHGTRLRVPWYGISWEDG